MPNARVNLLDHLNRGNKAVDYPSKRLLTSGDELESRMHLLFIISDDILAVVENPQGISSQGGIFSLDFTQTAYKLGYSVNMGALVYRRTTIGDIIKTLSQEDFDDKKVYELTG